MNLPLVWEFYVVCDWSQDLCYREGSFLFWWQSLGSIAYLQGPAIQLYLFSFLEWGKALCRPLCLLLSRQFMCHSSLVSCLVEGFHLLFCSWGICLIKHQGDIFWFVPHHEVEQGLFHGGVDLLIVTELHEGVEQFPCSGVVGAEDSKIDFKFLVDSFCFSISLRVIHYASECFDS